MARSSRKFLESWSPKLNKIGGGGKDYDSKDLHDGGFGVRSGSPLALSRSTGASLLGPSVTETALKNFLDGIPGVDVVGAHARAAGFASRSIKTASKAWGLDTIIRMIDLTTLEGADTPGKVRTLAKKAVMPDPGDAGAPHVAAVCVYGDMVAHTIEALGDWHLSRRPEGVSVAAVATAFPSGRASLPVKILDTEYAVAQGADEIDMVIDRGAFLSGKLGVVFDQIVAVKEACKRPDGSFAHLKVILETGELATLDNVRKASWLAILAGADFIKTSTGKVQPAATLPVTVTMLEVIRDWHGLTGEKIGMKPAGGIKTSKDALRYLVAVAETLGEQWLDPHLFRFGASSLLNDVVLQRQKMRTGHYSGPDYVTVD
jgi:deoxyribose-phosphate aldolase